MIGGPFFLWLLFRRRRLIRRRAVALVVLLVGLARAGARITAQVAARRLDHPGDHGNAVRDGRRRSAGCRRQLRSVSAGGASDCPASARSSIRTSSAFSRCGPISSSCTARRPTCGRSSIARASPTTRYVHRGLPDIPETIRSLGARVGMSRQADGLADHLERELADIRDPGRGPAATQDAPGLRSRGRLAAEHQLERRCRISARHAGDCRRRRRVRRRQAAGGASRRRRWSWRDRPR